MHMSNFYYCGPEFELFDTSVVGAAPLLYGQIVSAVNVFVCDRDASMLIVDYVCGPAEFRTLFNSELFQHEYHVSSGYLIPTMVDSTLVCMLLRCGGSVVYALNCLHVLLFVRGMQDECDSSRDIFEDYYGSEAELVRIGVSQTDSAFGNLYASFGQYLELNLRMSRTVYHSLDSYYKFATQDYKAMLYEYMLST